MNTIAGANRSADNTNLDLHTLHLDVAFGRSKGKIIWQPRIGCWLADKKWAGESLGRYEAMSSFDIFRDLKCSARLYEFNDCFRRSEPAVVKRKNEWIDESNFVSIIETPAGTVTEVQRKSPNSWALLRDKRWIETPEDMKILTWLNDNSSWEFDRELFDKLSKQTYDLGAPTIFMPRVNVQDLYINTMGVEHGVYALYEWPLEISDYFRALHENHLRMIDVINSSPVEIINFGDNVHSSTLPPSLFEEYVLPAYLERCAKLHEAGKFVSSHWDGDTKPLLKYAKVCGLDGIEAITPKPQGDVTFDEMKEALGEDVFLLDGIPAVYFDEMFSEDQLLECTHQIIDLFAPKLILGISDEISSTGDIERIRLVGKAVEDYNASVLR